MQSPQPTIVDTLEACQSAVDILKMEQLLAVDSEGVHLSRTGPLTLLQVSTPTGRVFLFDIPNEPRMFKDGGLQDVLERDDIVKVLHSAKNDAEALYSQYGVELQNVHDTQVAHRERLRSEGHRFPPRGRLSEVCAIYCPEKSSLVDADKDLVGTKMNRSDGEYWARRPLTQEMINYAASDVIALIPEMYIAQKQMLEEKGLMDTFQSRVERELKSVKDPDELKALRQEERDTLVSTLREAAETVGGQRFQDITDDNVVEALRILHLNKLEEMGLPPVIRDLKLQQMQAKLDEVEHEMEEKGSDYNGHSICRQLFAFVNALESHPMKDHAQRLLTRAHKLILEDIRHKYTALTPLKHIAYYEQRIIARGVYPKGEHDSSVDPVLCRLYWKVKEEELEYYIDKCKADPSKFQVSKGYAKTLKWYTSGDVPARMKELGTDFLKVLLFLGKVSPPPQATEDVSDASGGAQIAAAKEG